MADLSWSGVNDRGPFHSDRIIDLSYTAASKLGLIGNGSGQVEVRSILPGEASMVAGKLEQPPVAEGLAPMTPSTAPAETLVESSDAKGTWLQLGAFGNRENAEAMKSRMNRELGNLGERLVIHSVNNLFRLQLGPWSNAAEAQSVAQKIGEMLEFKPVVVQR
jgi:rare lipoprotein A